MNILITGGGGFLGESLRERLLEKGYSVCSPLHKDLDVCNLEQLKLFLSNNRFQYVIHCAIKGGRLLKEESPNNFYENILMQENLLSLNKYYDKLILFNSGAQENRSKDINNLKEGEFYDPPTNLYSLSKYINAKRALNNNKVIALRIFNCFGIKEIKDRFISTCLTKYINKKDIEIWGDTYFDFFGINDLFLVLKHLLETPPIEYTEINLCYKKKYLLSEIANIINNLDKYKVGIKIIPGINKNYTGDGDKLYSLNLPLMGLENEISNMYKQLLEEHGSYKS